MTEPGGLIPSRLLARSNLPTTFKPWRLFPAGLLAGFFAMSAILISVALAGHARYALATTTPASVATTLLVFAATFLLVGLSEELQNRGYIFRAFTDGIGFWPAALLTSSWFAFTHLLEGDPWYGALSTGLRGLFFCLTWRATESLAFAIGFHAAWDYTESAIFGVPDSSFTIAASLLSANVNGPVWLTGGSVGPEGSVLAYAVSIVLIFAALTRIRRLTRKAAIDGLGSSPREAYQSVT